MFKTGDKVICIGNIDTYNNDHRSLQKGEVYTVEYYRRDKFKKLEIHRDRYIYDQILVAEDSLYHSDKLFITLKENRKKKLKNIESCLNEVIK